MQVSAVRGFDRPILGTRATLDIAELVLRDGLRINGASDPMAIQSIAAATMTSSKS
jgi:hypothetical protein